MKYSYELAPVVPEASNVMSSTAQTTSLVAPEIKLTTGNAEASTVTVTTFEVALAKLDGTGQVVPPRDTKARRLKAVVADNGAGSKVKDVAPGISAKAPEAVLLCH